MTGADRLPVDSDRAQLLLVGAVAIGLILLGLVVVYNTILFTDTREPTQSLDDTADTRVLRQQVVNDTRLLVQALHEDKGFQCNVDTATDSRLETYLTGNITDLGEGQTYSQASTGVKFVDITPGTISCASSGDEVDVTYDLTVQTPETEYDTTVTRSFNTSKDFSCEETPLNTPPLIVSNTTSKSTNANGTGFNVTVEFEPSDAQSNLETGYVTLTDGSGTVVAVKKINLKGESGNPQTVKFTGVTPEPNEAIILVEDTDCASNTPLTTSL